MTALPVGVEPGVIASIYPRLYHLTHVDNWDLIRRIGLLSASALLDLFGVDGEIRRLIESSNRRELVPIRHATYGVAILRDQKPMDDRGLERALSDGITPEEWYRLVNRHVFFWVDRGRVDRLLGARAYRRERHALLVARTRELLDRHAPRTVLSPLNTGATKPMPHPRGRNCFVPLAFYPFAYWRDKRNVRDAVVELAVQMAVPDFTEVLERVSIVGRGEPEEVIWNREPRTR
jgi:uncharacterized protein DUF7002